MNGRIKVIIAAIALLVICLSVLIILPASQPQPPASNSSQFDPSQYDFVDGFSEDIALVYVNKKHGFITRTGEVIAKPQFDFAIAFKYGYAAVKLDGKYGSIDREGNILLSDDELDGINSFGEDHFASVTKQGKFGLINTKGEYLLEPIYDYIDFEPKNGFRKFAIGDQVGFIDKDGNIATKSEF
ncbi:hypothetical protein FACS189487_09020 [Campylobacterota bacterium]|nr:hypothetical protein FACS189487_09020 [Campylobacterota bacterium]